MAEDEDKPKADSQASFERGERPVVKGPDMEPYQFEVDIVSVHYYQEREWAYCAILLSTTFQLRNNMLESARIQICVETEDEGLRPSIDISSHYPDQELVEVLRGSETKVVSRNPNVAAGGTVATILVSGIGNTKTTATDVPRTISLVGSRKPKREDRPPEIEWIFENQCGVYYPTQTKTLLIVEARTQTTKFPFNLCFNHPPLEIQVHSKGWFSRQRFKKRPPAPVGWTFRVVGVYKPGIADKAVRDTTRTPDKASKHFGLKNAAKDWIELRQEQTQGQGNGVQNGQPE